MSNEWTFAEPDLASIMDQHASPLDALADGVIPAIVLRQVFHPDSCQRLIDRLIEQQLLYDPRQPISAQFQEAAIPEGYYREGNKAGPSFAWEEKKESGRTRIDVGTSLGYRGSNKEAFLAHSAETLSLFERLFPEPTDNPIRLLYQNLQALSCGRRVETAHEPDGRRYGPAIIRAHYGGYTYKPHFDSVRLREKRADYAVHDFAHQFAGVLVLQNTCLREQTAQCILHRQLWQPKIDEILKSGKFHDFAQEQQIENVRVCLEPGDLYFFNTRSIHEVPGLAGELPRIVLATFIGYSSDRDDIFVWS
ncbi:MAG TPA: hypothetical protein EYG57_06325 [Planctomycetes bacterium]|nr:hypothetical protein [Planctomycetaceae bacterium]HIM29155.1 hypothetical protein [Planctomycetota bacterium]